MEVESDEIEIDEQEEFNFTLLSAHLPQHNTKFYLKLFAIYTFLTSKLLIKSIDVSVENLTIAYQYSVSKLLFLKARRKKK